MIVERSRIRIKLYKVLPIIHSHFVVASMDLGSVFARFFTCPVSSVSSQCLTTNKKSQESSRHASACHYLKENVWFRREHERSHSGESFIVMRRVFADRTTCDMYTVLYVICIILYAPDMYIFIYICIYSDSHSWSNTFSNEMNILILDPTVRNL